jgi:cell division septation protein DedD
MTEELEVVQNDAIASIERAQVDVQISTARKYPRTLSKVKERMLSFATLDEETASSCFYTLPARRGGDDKPIQGPSVRMAEIALASYQHVKAGSRIISDDGKFLTAQAVVHDLENNVAVSIEVRRRVTSKSGARYSDDMIAVTGNAACSIALRNAVFRVVPRALITPVYEAAKRVAIGDVKSLTSKRSQIIARLKQMGAKDAAILAAVGADKIEDIDLARLEVLIGLGTAIKDGEITLETAFPGASPKEEGKPIFKDEPKPAPAAPEQPAAAPTTPQPPNPAGDPTGTPQERLAAVVTQGGFTLQQFSEWAIAIGFHTAAIAEWSEVSDQVANRILRSPTGLITQLKGMAK